RPHSNEGGRASRRDVQKGCFSPKTESMNLVLIGILASEIGFWVVLILGLATRYLLRWRKVSTILLLGVPVLDVFLLSLISWDLLLNDTVADFTHGLGAVYLGFTIAFGRQIISRVD